MRKMQFVNKAALGVMRGSNDSKCFRPSRRKTGFWQLFLGNCNSFRKHSFLEVEIKVTLGVPYYILDRN